MRSMREDAPITDLLASAKTAEERDALWLLLVPALRVIAARRIGLRGLQQQERPTELVNQVFPALARVIDSPTKPFASREQFFKYAKMAMQSSLRDEALKGMTHELFEEDLVIATASTALQLVIWDALDKLEVQMPRPAKAFQLRHVFGFSHAEILREMQQEYRSDASLAADLTRAKRALAAMLGPEE